MSVPTTPVAQTRAAFARLTSLTPLCATDLDLLEEAARTPQRFAPHRELVREGEPVREPCIILSGWACRVRHFNDGRRQILGMLLPGDLIGHCQQRDPVAATTIVALTHVTLCPTPAASQSTSLAGSYAVSAALAEAYLYRQIARIGRLNAYERIIDWLLEIRDRLSAMGISDALPMPVTQEALADTLGLTSVHVNRTLQALRGDGLLEWRTGLVKLRDPAALEKAIDYRPVRVTAATR